MSKKQKNIQKTNKKNDKNVSDKRDYKNPMDSVWGKIIIWILIFGMIGIVIIGAIFTIISAFK